MKCAKSRTRRPLAECEYFPYYITVGNIFSKYLYPTYSGRLRPCLPFYPSRPFKLSDEPDPSHPLKMEPVCEAKVKKKKRKLKIPSVPNDPTNPNTNPTTNPTTNLNDTLSAGIFNETGMVSDGYDTQSSTSVDSQGETNTGDPNPKKFKPLSADAEFLIEDPLALHVHITSSDGDNSELKKLDPWDITESIQYEIGTFIGCKTLNSGIILVQCECNTQVKKLVDELKSFRGIPVIAKIAFNIDTVRGVIRDARLTDISTEKLLKRLQDQGVVHVRPIYGGLDKHRTDYTILTFRLSKLPEKNTFLHGVKRGCSVP